MASQYSSFLQAPSTSLLAADATLVYITTTTEISGPTAILKHLQAQSKQLEKKTEKVLSTIEGQNGVCMETETTLLFKTGGGAYLPGIDENLLDERTVTLPMTHIVSFDPEQKIQQIRMYWDQGSLLKQVEAIGRSGRNWPIRDATVQLDAINKSLKAAGKAPANGTTSIPLRGPQDVLISQHKRAESVSATRDPHASLSLFAPRDPNEDAANRTYNGPKHATRESAKPAPRDLTEIFVDDQAGSRARDPSPTKNDGTILKSGAGKYHTHNRLFDENGEHGERESLQHKRIYKDKYGHFDFGDGEDAPEARSNGKKSGGTDKNQASFDFADFSTPPKIEGKSRPDYDRQWGDGVQPVSHAHDPRHMYDSADATQDDPPSPVKRPIVHAARPDAEPHFAIQDDSPQPAAKPKSYQRQRGMGLYQDPLQADERTAISKSSNRRGDESRAHYSLADEETPEKNKKIYKTAGDGMGGRKSGGRLWGIGSESDPEEMEANVRPSARSRRADAQAQAGAGGH